MGRAASRSSDLRPTDGNRCAYFRICRPQRRNRSINAGWQHNRERFRSVCFAADGVGGRCVGTKLKRCGGTDIGFAELEVPRPSFACLRLTRKGTTFVASTLVSPLDDAESVTVVG
jgi:hypothetical protein